MKKLTFLKLLLEVTILQTQIHGVGLHFLKKIQT